MYCNGITERCCCDFRFVSIRFTFCPRLPSSSARADAFMVNLASRAAYTDRYLALLSAYISAPPVDSNKSIRPPISVDPSSPSLVSAASGHFSNVAAENLYHFIAQPRSRILDFGIQDSATGTTILHETVRRADLGLMKCVLARGGSPKSRDRKLKLPADFSKDERIQAVLKQGQ